MTMTAPTIRTLQKPFLDNCSLTYYGKIMGIETYVETVRNRLTSWQVEVTIERREAEMSYLRADARWLKEVGRDNVVSVTSVKVGRRTTDFPQGTIYSEFGYEILFKSGAIGLVCPREPSSDELDALVVGSSGYLHGLAVWRKRGNVVGRPVPWLMTKQGARKRLNPNSVPRVCAAELYARARGDQP